MIRTDATERQNQASRPDTSTWLAANAGSGKTRVLIDRVARLLLDGVDPQKILCLTYTKAAASEMQNRLFQRLGQWAMLDDAALTAALADLDAGGDRSAPVLRRARTLFARAIETPGGLKIQTIHSFCASLLRRFPLEAGVSPQFKEAEDRAIALACEDVLEEMASGPDVAVVDGLARYVSDEALSALIPRILSARDAFAAPITWDNIANAMGCPADLDEKGLLDRVFDGTEEALITRILPKLSSGSKQDQTAAAHLSEFRAGSLAGLTVLESVLLFGESAKMPFGAKLEKFPTKSLRTGSMQADMPELEALMRRVEAVRPLRVALAAAQRTYALHRFAQVFLPRLERLKQSRAWLDFDDLIQRARHLLHAPEVAEWVLFRLDGGIDHILVDEAQDTSPAQWDVIRKLAQEFTSGLGARPDHPRTIFVVGDKKQSIYSFQGADPDAFDAMQQEFAQRLDGSASRLETLSLEYSFRSSPAVLGLVDEVFAQTAPSGLAPESRHIAFKTDLPGRVDLWPFLSEAEKEEDPHWTDPVDRPGRRHHSVVLAEQIAERIKAMLDSKATIPLNADQRRPVQPGDFLILLQRRSTLFAEIIRACKALDLPIAGADRLKVGAEMAVKDLGALLSFVATPEDSLSLAIALKSPLFGWAEQELFDLAHRRSATHLWTALRDRAEDFPETLSMLNDLRRQSDFLRPYDLIERILVRHSGRKRLLARLGPEAEDGINALLSQALAYERSAVPSLTGFLVWMQTDALEIKRQADTQSSLIRVMTVHGAKGLESPIVILPDTAAHRAPPGDPILMAGDVPVWKPAKADMPETLSPIVAERSAKEDAERMRLLYVALTRAETWLIVAGAGKLNAQGNSWYQFVEAGLQQLALHEIDCPGGPGQRYATGDWESGHKVSRDVQDVAEEPLPRYLTTNPVPQDPARPTISPSELGGAKALPGEAGQEEAAALARGTAIHHLIEALPTFPGSDPSEIARHLLADAQDVDVPSALAEALSILNAPELGFLFGDNALSEVSVTADFGPDRLHGTIDRLLIEPERVLAVDFKTNAMIPATPEQVPDGILRQLGAYAHALAQIYPTHRVETAVVWTRTAKIMYVPHDLVFDKVNPATNLDLPQRHS